MSLSRRSLLLASSAAAALTATGCSSKSGGGGKASDSAGVKLPTYIEFDKVKPDLPGNEQGLQQGFLKFPEEFVASTEGTPLKGAVTGLTETFAVPSPAMNKNPFWQRLNKTLGGELDLIIGTDPGYPEKFATILASDDLPDMMWVPPNQGLPNVGPMLEAKFTDLTKYLSGDAIKEYPNLAALKPSSWKTAVVNGKIWGAPIPSTPFGQVMGGNPAVWKKVGGLQCSTAQEFFEKCKELSTGNRYALEPSYINMMHMFGEWFGVPNGWRVNKDRTLTWGMETDNYKAALEYAAKLFKAGVFHPNANLPDARPLVAQGQLAAFVSVGPIAVGELRAFKKDVQADVMVPFGWDGKAKPVYDMGYGTVGFTPFKKADEGKIRELLSLINWLSAPFGTTEWVAKNFGAKDQDWVRKDGDLVLTTAAETNAPGLVSALQIMSSCENPLYQSGHPEDTRKMHDLEKQLLPMAQQAPTKGTYSDTNSKKGAKIGAEVRDTMVDVLTGRKKMADFDAAVKRWRAQGGDQIREEYQKVLPEGVPVTE